MKFYPQILSSKQKEVLGKLKFLENFNAYLAGGTALALQLGHRTSLDFDFYSPKKLPFLQLRGKLVESFTSLTLGTQTEDTFQADINGVSFSVFYYPYSIVKKLIEFPPIRIASLEDIAAMKVVAVIQRAKQRDFWDLYYLIEKLGVEKVIKSAFRKYPWYEENSQIVLKALTYFDEADSDQEVNRIVVFDKKIRWNEVKKKINQEVKVFFASESMRLAHKYL